MKRILYSSILFIALFFSKTASAQVFWTETFGTGPCNQGNVASTGVPTATNGAWTINLLAAAPGNDPDANEWFISGAELGNTVGSCNTATCGTNRTMHVGNVSTSPSAPFVCPTGDCGSSYDAGTGANDVSTHKRAESPTINCTGQTGIIMTFNYIYNADPPTDGVTVEYSLNNGGTWTAFASQPTQLGVCGSLNYGGLITVDKGQWQTITMNLPATANNIATLKIGFRWQNLDGNFTAADPSFAVDDITLQKLAYSFTTATTACVNQTVNATVTGTVAGATYGWTVTPAGPTIAPATGSQVVITYPTSGTFSVIGAALSGTNVVGTATQVVTVSPAPTVAVAPTTQTICPGTTATLTASGASTYTWMPGTLITPVINPSPAATTVYTVTGTSAAGCTATANGTVVVQPFTVSITPPTQTICPGNTATLTANAIPSATFQWVTGTFPAITPLGTSSTQTVSPGTTTTYSVVAGVGSCTAIASTTVTIGASLTINALASPTAVCAGGPVTLSASGATSYTWIAPPSTVIGNTASVTANPTVATTYTVLGSSSGCSGSQTVAVGITSGLSLTVAASSATVCPGQTTTLTVTGGVNYTWSPASSLSTTSGSVTNAAPTTATTYTVLGDNGAGCNGSAQITINMGAGSSIGVSSTASAVCTGFTSTLTATGATSYTWTGSTFTTSVVQPSVSVGPGTYTVQGSSGAGCNSFSVINVSLAPPLNIQVTQSSATTCIASNYPMFSQPVVLNATGASIYSWSQCNPLYMTICIGPTITVRPPASTCYTVTGSTSVCSGSAAVCVTVRPQFTVAVTPQQPIMCLGDSIILRTTNIGTLAVLPIPVASPTTNGYVWTEPANAPPPSLSNPLSPTVVAKPTVTCTYTLEVYDGNHPQCVSVPRLVTVTVLPQPLTSIAIPTINNVPTNTVCFVGLSPGAPDNTLTLTGSNNNVGLPFGVVPTYTWSSGYQQAPCNQQSILTPVNNNSVIVNAPCRLPSLVTYTVVSGYNGVPGCRRIDTVTVRGVDCRPVRNILFETAIPNDTICSRTCVTFINHTDTMAGGPQTYTWTFPGGAPATSTLNNPTTCYNLAGTYNVILKVANPYAIATGGSTLTTYRNSYIKVVDIPNVTIIPPGQYISDTIVRFGECVSLKGYGAKTYQWRPDYDIHNNLTTPNVTVCPQHTTQYILQGWNSKQCYSSDTINVIVVQDCGDMFVPNAFSPNGDGANDVLYVRGHCLETLTFMVFNRWGEKVFETADQDVGWDGVYKGESMNTGVFVYRLEGKDYSGKGYSMKGNVTLIR